MLTLLEELLVINKYSNVPLYSQLKNLIIQKIDSGEYAYDTRIPSEQEFCDMYDISRPTVRQAINELTTNGYLYKLKGKGTFVTKAKTKISIKNFSGFTDSILDSQDRSKHNVLSLHTIRSGYLPHIDNVFGNSDLTQNYEYAEIKYTTIEQGNILSLNVSYIPLNLFPDIIDDIKAGKASHEIMLGKYPLLPARTNSILEIAYTEQSEAQHLQVQTGHPLIKIENLLYSKMGQPVEFVIAKYRADKCTLVFENSK